MGRLDVATRRPPFVHLTRENDELGLVPWSRTEWSVKGYRFHERDPSLLPCAWYIVGTQCKYCLS